MMGFTDYRQGQLKSRNNLFEIAHQGFDLAAVHARLGKLFRILSHLLTCATDGVALLVEETLDLANEDHVLALVVATITPSFNGFQLWKFRFPIP